MGEEGENEENKGTSLRFGTFAFRRYRLSFVLLLLPLFFATKLVADKSIDPSLFMSRTFRATLVALNSAPLNGVKWI